jgi:hypothetical protein
MFFGFGRTKEPFWPRPPEILDVLEHRASASMISLDDYPWWKIRTLFSQRSNCMRIFVFQAFASNNSGSYTIVGTFRDAATAESVAHILSHVAAAHDEWHKNHEWDEDGVSPLDEFVQQHGLRSEKPGRGDEWPNYGDSPTVMASGDQVVVHSPYTVTMPPVFGEFFYAKGGRVQVELNHAHDDIAVEFTFWVPSSRYDDPSNREKLDAFETRLAGELGPLTGRREHDRRPLIEPAWHRGHWGARHLSVVFCDLVEGVSAVRRLANEMGVQSRLDLRECPSNVQDPFATLRGSTIPWGAARIILWQIGDRIAAMKALREVLGCGLDEAKKFLDDVPREMLLDVDLAYANKARETLVQAGCDAEVVVPAKRDK